MRPTVAVLDASVLVSALLTDGVPRTILDRAKAGAFVLVLSTPLLAETRRSLLKPRTVRKYRHPPSAVDDYCDALTEIAMLVEGDPDFVSACRDPDDHHVIATAVAARADLLVTGDRHLLDLGAHETIRIVDPLRFLDELTRARSGTR